MLCLSTLILAAQATNTVAPIFVDQFGWRPQDHKVAVFAFPMKGQNADNKVNFGESFEVHSAADDKLVYSGKLQIWNGGVVSKLAGDIVWHADFSSVKDPGSYYVLDPKSGTRSYKFKI